MIMIFIKIHYQLWSIKAMVTLGLSLLSFYSRIQPLGRTSNNNETKVKEVAESKLLALYDNYKDLDSPDYILAEGMEKLLSDLNLSPDEFKVLVLAWRLNAETMCQFSKDEFITGLKNMRTDSIKSISHKLPELCKEVLNDPELFKDLYRFTFRFGLDKMTGQRILPSDMAICLWKIVFSLKEPPILEKWLKFLESHPNIRGIPCDTWNMFLNLIDTIGSDLSSYDDAEAWPSIFDDFVEYENDQMNQNITKEKEGIIQDCL
ncbi:conserved hypothetical protein [Pediculus humanus corporis]|uniref:Defective in cullin neddylation protein n=1 Tax=Pediculus humanus subsp. corporis TaxID=121224 RepID=E0W2G2_PEDHC|nr:uncharacterized protein Phum_PHUM591840 [Pediculus humanus corporis]EEB19818.1 conserved hypothetical protein [Pediculus humanus corporis]